MLVMRSETTPTTSTTFGGWPAWLNGIVMRCPMGFPPLDINRPNDSLTIATGGDPSRSSAENRRPLVRRTPRAAR